MGAKGKGFATSASIPGRTFAQGVKRPLSHAGLAAAEGYGGAVKRHKGAGGKAFVAQESSLIGEVRYQNPEDAAKAVRSLDSQNIEGSMLSVELDETSVDGTKVIVGGLPLGLEWQELKDVFSTCGPVAFAGIKRQGKGGKGAATSSVAGADARIGEVRFISADEAAYAVEVLDGSDLADARISVELDGLSQDHTKVRVRNVPSWIEWQELKDHFSQAGQVAFCEIRGSGKGGAKGHGAATPAPARASPMAPSAGGGLGGTSAEVRYESVAHAQIALKALNGLEFGESRLWVKPFPGDAQGNRLSVSGVPAGTQWQELKDIFGQCGPVAFVEVGKGAATKGHVKGWQAPAPRGGAKGGGHAGIGKGSVASLLGEIRFENADLAQEALQQLNGTMFQGAQIAIAPDRTSQDQTKLVVHGLPAGCEWQELKDHFSQVGPVAYAGILRSAPVQGGAYPSSAPKGSAPKGSARKGSGKSGWKQQEQVLVGEVRFASAEAAHAATNMDGMELDGHPISVHADPKSHDGTKVVVFGLPDGLGRFELKDQFQTCGEVAYCNVTYEAASRVAGFQDAGFERVGEVRFATPEQAASACQKLSGTEVHGGQIEVQVDPMSHDGVKVLVAGLPSTVAWQEMKSHFQQVGEVVFAGFLGPTEVRYETTEQAREAVGMFHGSDLHGCKLVARLDPSSRDGTRIRVSNVPPSMQIADLKEFFGSAGSVQFVKRMEIQK